VAATAVILLFTKGNSTACAKLSKRRKKDRSIPNKKHQLQQPQMASFARLKNVLRFLNRFHRNQLLLSNTLSTIGLLAVGDTLTQYIEIKLTNAKIIANNDKKKKPPASSSFLDSYNPTRTGNYNKFLWEGESTMLPVCCL
jgi:hypothetical protein